MTKILALTTCYNRKEKTLNAINSLIDGNRDIDFSFVICDDNSTDGTYEELSKINNVEIIKGTGSLYWAGGMRRAIDVALNKKESFDYCLLFNDDVMFFEHSIEKLISNNNEVMVGPTCDKRKNISYGGIVKSSNIRPKYRTVMGQECDTFNANCVLIPWSTLIINGNFDSNYVHSLADYDYGLKLKRSGCKIVVASEFVGECENNTSKSTWRDVNLSKKERIRKKENAKGLPFKQWFHYLNKNYNLITATIYSITPYIHILFNV